MSYINKNKKVLFSYFCPKYLINIQVFILYTFKYTKYIQK